MPSANVPRMEGLPRRESTPTPGLMLILLLATETLRDPRGVLSMGRKVLTLRNMPEPHARNEAPGAGISFPLGLRADTALPAKAPPSPRSGAKGEATGSCLVSGKARPNTDMGVLCPPHPLRTPSSRGPAASSGASPEQKARGKGRRRGFAGARMQDPHPEAAPRGSAVRPARHHSTG